MRTWREWIEKEGRRRRRRRRNACLGENGLGRRRRQDLSFLSLSLLPLSSFPLPHSRSYYRVKRKRERTFFFFFPGNATFLSGKAKVHFFSGKKNPLSYEVERSPEDTAVENRPRAFGFYSTYVFLLLLFLFLSPRSLFYWPVGRRLQRRYCICTVRRDPVGARVALSSSLNFFFRKRHSRLMFFPVKIFR